jgi:hypothetical protein
MTEKELQNNVRAAALLFGWRFYHTWMSIRSAKGFPDCVLVRGERLLFAELKAVRGKVSAEQQAWLDDLDAVGAEAYLWRPAHWLSGEIERVLR